MPKQSDKIILLILLVFISISLVSAFIIEYLMGYEPCKLCLYQRIPYIVSFFFIIAIFQIKKFKKNFLFLLFITFLISSILAFYHFGIEQGFFKESLACTAENLSKEDIIKQMNKNAISCKTVTFQVFGLSLATINTIFSFVLFGIFLKLFRNYETNK